MRGAANAREEEGSQGWAPGGWALANGAWPAAAQKKPALLWIHHLQEAAKGVQWQMDWAVVNSLGGKFLKV